MMRKIMLLNAKGGSGKTTLAINLASYFIAEGKTVTLADLDPQRSSLGWLESRQQQWPAIESVQPDNGRLRVSRKTDYLILDTPAGRFGKDLTALVRKAETILIPVQPSATDMRAAARFVHDVLNVGKVDRREVRVALVANRAPVSAGVSGSVERLMANLHIPFSTGATTTTTTLQHFLQELRVPLLTTLHDSEVYRQADAEGRGIFELPHIDTVNERRQWQPILDWLRSRRSQPIKKKKPARRPRVK